MSMYSGDCFDESFIRLLGLPPSTSQDAQILTAGLGSTHNPAEHANVAVLTPLVDALLSRGLKTPETDDAKELDTRNHGNHIAIISRQSFRDTLKGRELSVLTSAVSIDGHLLPLIPAWLTSNGLPQDFGTQTESFEYSSSCAALVFNTRKEDRTCGIIASEHTQQHLKMQLKRACTNTGIWQGANGHGFIDLCNHKIWFTRVNWVEYRSF